MLSKRPPKKASVPFIYTLPHYILRGSRINHVANLMQCPLFMLLTANGFMAYSTMHIISVHIVIYNLNYGQGWFGSSKETDEVLLARLEGEVRLAMHSHAHVHSRTNNPCLWMERCVFERQQYHNQLIPINRNHQISKPHAALSYPSTFTTFPTIPYTRPFPV